MLTNLALIKTNIEDDLEYVLKLVNNLNIIFRLIVLIVQILIKKQMKNG